MDFENFTPEMANEKQSESLENKKELKKADIELISWEFSDYDEARLDSYLSTEAFDTKQEATDSIKGFFVEYDERNNEISQDVSAERIKLFIENNFSKELLLNSLTSRVVIRTDINVIEAKERIYIENEVLREYLKTQTEGEQDYTKSCVRRAESYASWRENDDKDREGTFYGKYFSSPVVLFNQDYLPDLNEFDYLEEFENAEKKEQYVLGSVAHEIGHQAFAFILNESLLLEEWKGMIGQNGNITQYAADYEAKYGKKEYDENFAEAVRLFKTSPNFLKSRHEKVYDFVERFFREYNS